MTQRNFLKPNGHSLTEDNILQLVLKKNEGFLRRHLVLSPTIIGKLITTEIIGDTVHTRIKRLSNEEQVDALLNVLRRSGMHVFRKFIEVLRTSMDSWIVDVLLETNIAEALLSGKRILFKDHLKTLEPFKIDLGYKTTESTGLPHTEKESRRLIVSSLNDLNTPVAVPRNLNRQPSDDLQGKSLMSSTYLQRTILTFENERQLQESVLNALRQEETKIRDRLEKNIAEQAKQRKKQKSLLEIEKKLKQVSYENSQLPSSLSRPSKLRLMNSHRIPKNQTFHFDSF